MRLIPVFRVLDSPAVRRVCQSIPQICPIGFVQAVIVDIRVPWGRGYLALYLGVIDCANMFGADFPNRNSPSSSRIQVQNLCVMLEGTLFRLKFLAAAGEPLGVGGSGLEGLLCNLPFLVDVARVHLPPEHLSIVLRGRYENFPCV